MNVKRAFALRRGFTMIELLMVISIILFLMAFIVGVFLKVSQGGRVRATKALIEKVGMGLAQYQADFRALPPDSGFNQAVGGSGATYVDATTNITYINYDWGSLYRYLAQPLKQYHPADPLTLKPGSFWRIVGPYISFQSGELKPYKGGTAPYVDGFQVVDAWHTPIGYIGDSRRVIHNRSFCDIFSCGPDLVTAETDGKAHHVAGANGAYSGAVTDNASLMGAAQLNGTFTQGIRLKTADAATEQAAGTVMDDLNNWDSQY